MRFQYRRRKDMPKTSSYKVGQKHYAQIGVKGKTKPKTGQQGDMWENTVKTWNDFKKMLRGIRSGLALGGWKPKSKRP